MAAHSILGIKYTSHQSRTYKIFEHVAIVNINSNYFLKQFYVLNLHKVEIWETPSLHPTWVKGMFSDEAFSLLGQKAAVVKFYQEKAPGRLWRLDSSVPCASSWCFPLMFLTTKEHEEWWVCEIRVRFPSKKVEGEGKDSKLTGQREATPDSFIFVMINWHLTSDCRPDVYFFFFFFLMDVLHTTSEKPSSVKYLIELVLGHQMGVLEFNSILTLPGVSTGPTS